MANLHGDQSLPADEPKPATQPPVDQAHGAGKGVIIEFHRDARDAGVSVKPAVEPARRFLKLLD